MTVFLISRKDSALFADEEHGPVYLHSKKVWKRNFCHIALIVGVLVSYGVRKFCLNFQVFFRHMSQEGQLSVTGKSMCTKYCLKA